MNPIYRGDCSIEEVPGSKLSQNRGQAAVLTRGYEGDASDLTAFLNAHPILSTDSEIPSMVLDKYECLYDGPTVKVTLTYYGLSGVLGSNAGELQSDMSWYPKCAILNTDNPADGAWSVNYSAPTITFRYSTSARLTNPQFEGAAKFPDNITLGDAQQMPVPGGGPQNPTRQGQFLYQCFATCDNFRRTQRGNVYDYQETWVVVVQKPDTASMGTIGVGGASSPQSF